MALKGNILNKPPTATSQKLQLLRDAAIQRHQNGELESAELIYAEILKIDTNNLMAAQLSGLLALQKKQYLKAIEMLSKALTLKPNNAEIYNNRSTALY